MNGPLGFYLHALDRYVVRGLPNLYEVVRTRVRRQPRRTIAYSIDINDRARERLFENVRDIDGEELYERVVNERAVLRYGLRDGAIRYGDGSDIQKRLFAELARALGVQAQTPARVLEFGSGYGKDLLWLKRNYPALSVTGADISPKSVAVARDLAQRLGLDIDYVCLTDHSLPFRDGHFDFAFTSFCLEQCPGTYKLILAELMRVTRRSLVLLEPMPEQMDYSLRGFLSRLHALYNDYPSGILRHLRTVGAPIKDAQRLGWAPNPLWEPSVVVIDTSMPHDDREWRA